MTGPRGRVSGADQTHQLHRVKLGGWDPRKSAQLLPVGINSRHIEPGGGQRLSESPVPGTQPWHGQFWGVEKMALELAHEGWAGVLQSQGLHPS